MQKYITKAVDNFFSQTLGLNCKVDKKFFPKNIHVCKINLNIENNDEEFYIFMSQNILEKISEVMLFEENPTDEIIVDLIGECANLIIGNAKVLVENGEKLHTTLSTPEYQGYFYDYSFEKFDDKFYYKVNGESIMIAVNVTTLETV